MSQPNLHIYDSGGAGRPIVMIHGFPLSHESFAHQLDSLADTGLRVVAYDRRGFGQSEKPATGYDYDTLSDDLKHVVDKLNLSDVILLGFSMGGGEVARYISRHSEKGIAGLVFAAAVTPYLAKTAGNPDGPLDQKMAVEKLAALRQDREGYFAKFVEKFYSVDDKCVVSDQERQKAIALCRQSDQHAAIECMQAFATTDFRKDLARITVPTLVIHGDSDAVVPFEGSGLRTHNAIAHSQLELIRGGPHGINVSHSDQFNRRVSEFARSLDC
jgi:pimeloyl-ACP methyl ester carboxylesterase